MFATCKVIKCGKGSERSHLRSVARHLAPETFFTDLRTIHFQCSKAFEAMAQILRIALSLLALHLLCARAYTSGNSWKECTWKHEDHKDEGVIWACDFQKHNRDTPLHVYYSGNIRISGCHDCCNRWYFTFNGVECSTPGPIEGALYQAYAGNLNSHVHGHIEGFCRNIHEGNVRVEIRVGPCVGTGRALGNANTGFATMSRIFVEEVSLYATDQ
ncbi:collagen triple helix repeat-containing protein 1-like isoform X2 [Oculina patagonica]